MDHLPVVKEPVHEVPLVPYLGTTYDGGTFQDFPCRQGWSLDLISKGNYTGHHEHEVKGFLQAWLFFGLLVDTMNIPVDTKRFVSDCGRHITTITLPRLLRRWKLANRNALGGVENADYQRVRQTLHCASLVIARLCSAGSPYLASCLLPEEVRLSILILGETIHWASYEVFLSRGRNSRMNSVDAHTGFGHSSLVLSRMAQDGWCPSEIDKMASSLAPSSLLYLSQMKRSLTKRHDRCDAHHCIAFQMDPATYESSHVTEDCRCAHVGPLMSEVVKILENGEVPVITLRRCSRSASIQYKVVASSAPVKYVAISHVWSDGLGNMKQNTIPHCRVQDLYEKILALSGPGTFEITLWLDTFCVPLWYIYGEVRNLALDKMQQTYSDAAKVLVLDGELQASSMNVDYEEALMRISCSGWMRRLWTLHEGLLAQDLFIQFREGPTNINHFMHQWIRDAGQSHDLIRSRLSVDAAGLFWTLQSLGDSAGAERFEHMWNCAQWRSTSKSSDETLCIAMQLGLDISPIVSLPVEALEERMVTLLRSQRELPTKILFLNLPRLSRPGYRWAPSTFLLSMRSNTQSKGQAGTEYLNDVWEGIPPAICGLRGLELTGPGFRIHSPYQKKSRGQLEKFSWFFCPGNQKVFVLELRISGDAVHYESMTPATSDDLAIVIDDHTTSETSTGILVAVQTVDDDDTIVAAFACLVCIQEELNEELVALHKRFASSQETMKKISSSDFDLSLGKVLGQQQRWCIT